MKVPKPKKQKDLTPKIDKLWSELVKIKAGHKCEHCGGVKSLNAHHVFTKKNRATRWDTDNGICLCALHHTLGVFSAHGSPAFMDWMREHRGEDWYEALRAKSHTMVKLSRESKLAIAAELKEEISIQEGLE